MGPRGYLLEGKVFLGFFWVGSDWRWGEASGPSVHRKIDRETMDRNGESSN